MIIIAVVLLGLCFGSFINALVWRIHKQSTAKKYNKAYSISQGHSMCPACKHQLHVLDLIPVFSWLLLGARCRYCKAKISRQYPLVELLTAALFIISYWQWPYTLSGSGIVAFGLWLAILVILIALTVYDIRWMILPNRLVYPVIVLAVLLVISIGFADGWGAPGGSILGALFLSGLFWGIFQVSGGKWIGGGDVKLAVALGLLAGGLLESILLLFIASLLGTLVSLPLVLRNKKLSSRVPFGPFLIIATYIVFFWGGAIIEWYTRFIGV